MKIGLIDVDGKNFPNIALMKISAWHKSKGDTVQWYSLFDGEFDIVYKSKVFSFTPDYPYFINAKKVIGGGTGYAILNENGKEVYKPELDIKLSSEIEHIYPDYSLYPQFTEDTAYGFLSRGCPRGCAFCIVAGKEGRKAVKVANLAEFWNGQKKVVLCDPNILACGDWFDLLTQCKESGAEIDFNQGLDVRLMTPEKARLLAQIKIKQIHFAWDRFADREKVMTGLQVFKDSYDKRISCHDVIVYTIVNFDTTFEQDLERIYTLRDMGFWPYVMIYRKYDCDHKYRRLERWVNNRFIFSKCKRFEDYGRIGKQPLSDDPELFI